MDAEQLIHVLLARLPAPVVQAALSSVAARTVLVTVVFLPVRAPRRG